MIQKILDTWDMLGQPIYTGERLSENLTAITKVSIFTAGLGLVLFIMDILIDQINMFIPSLCTLIGGLLCAYFAGIKENREIAVLIPTLFCAFFFTFYALTGMADGTAILWSCLLPVGLCYFTSVRYGIILSVYYSVFYTLLFYTPFKEMVEGMYSSAFMTRFPLLYISLAYFNALAMTQYHKSVLFERYYCDKLNHETEEHTRITAKQYQAN